jgi:nitrite reductase/ring-hydroxylating ferredoxin subunit
MVVNSDSAVDLGLESSFNKLPAWIAVGVESFYLVHGKKGYLLLSTECPHAGSEVSKQADVFLCPDHGWRFELTQGVCVNGPRAKMYTFPVTVQDGHLIADLTEQLD